jgi:hypothetical protein
MTRIDLGWDRPPIALNDSHGNKWAESKGRKLVREHAAAKATGLEPVTEFPTVFTLHWQIPDRRIRDADRLSKVAKGVLDGCRDAGLIPADDWRYVVTSACTIHPPDGSPAAMWATFTPLESA